MLGIDEMPILHVDPEMLEYGALVSVQLRAVGASLRGISIDTNALSRQAFTQNFRTLPA